MKQIVIIAVIGILGAGAWFITSDRSSLNRTADMVDSVLEREVPDNSNADQSRGRYTDYSEAKLTQAYEHNILFFYAAWCPECRAYELALTSNPIPAGVQILKLDYDKETALKQKHGVTLQTTFVEVDPDGNQLAKWVGYSQDKSIQAVLNGLGIDP